jgi:hypothetical protein
MEYLFGSFEFDLLQILQIFTHIASNKSAKIVMLLGRI